MLWWGGSAAAAMLRAIVVRLRALIDLAGFITAKRHRQHSLRKETYQSSWFCSSIEFHAVYYCLYLPVLQYASADLPLCVLRTKEASYCISNG